MTYLAIGIEKRSSFQTVYQYYSLSKKVGRVRTGLDPHLGSELKLRWACNILSLSSVSPLLSWSVFITAVNNLVQRHERTKDECYNILAFRISHSARYDWLFCMNWISYFINWNKPIASIIFRLKVASCYKLILFHFYQFKWCFKNPIYICLGPALHVTICTSIFLSMTV